MGLATLGGLQFRIDPTSIQWTFKIKKSVIDTVGGHVVQVLGADLGDMVVQGSFGVGGWEEERAFLDDMKAMALRQVANGRIKNPSAPGSHFRYPPRNWDFVVSLLSYSQITWAPETINPGWELRLFVEEDNSGITKIAQDAYISRFSAGLGWKVNQYNGPVSQAEVDTTLGGQNPGDYLANHYGVPIPGGTG